MKVELGKTYICRNGRPKFRVIDIDETASSTTNVVALRCVPDGWTTSCALDGSACSCAASEFDLVAEYREPRTFKHTMYVAIVESRYGSVCSTAAYFTQAAALVAAGGFKVLAVIKVPIEWTESLGDTEVPSV